MVLCNNLNELRQHFTKKNKIQWNLYEEDILGEYCSVRLIQGARLMQIISGTEYRR